MVNTPGSELEEFLNIEIAVELDKGVDIDEVARLFGVSIKRVKQIAREGDLLKPRKHAPSTKRFNEAEKGVLVERVEAGEELEEVALSAGVNPQTLKRWCLLKGIRIPRALNSLSKKEMLEIREMLEQYDWREVAGAYNLSHSAVEALREPAYRKLDPASLGFLFELFKEQPGITTGRVIAIARKAGMDISAEAVDSYRDRLKKIRVP